jgi:hypothetical protein
MLFPKYVLEDLSVCSVSWEFRDSSHGDGLTEGLDSVRRWVWLGIVQLRHHDYPGSGPSAP